jgi:hypothetical protein
MTQTLVRIPPAEAQQFLSELANLSDDPNAIMRFARKFAKILPRMEEKRFQKELFEGPDFAPIVSENLPWVTIGKKGTPAWLVIIRAGIQNIWRAPDIRTREWVIYRLIDAAIIQEIYPPTLHPIFWTHSRPMTPMPPPTPFEQAIDYLRKHVRRLAYCSNSDCSAPFFFNGRRSQKYCSEDCARPSQQESKRLWWTKNRAKGTAQNPDA